MKMHITPQQAQEITGEQFYSLFDEIVKRDDWANFHHKKVTIGKCIEILEPYTPKIEKGRHWMMEIVTGKLPRYNFPTYQNKELCDCLWQAVKEIL